MSVSILRQKSNAAAPRNRAAQGPRPPENQHKQVLEELEEDFEQGRISREE
jgi:hypothetical protein